MRTLGISVLALIVLATAAVVVWVIRPAHRYVARQTAAFEQAATSLQQISDIARQDAEKRGNAAGGSAFDAKAAESISAALSRQADIAQAELDLRRADIAGTVRPTDLTPGQAVIDGIKGENRFLGPLPVRLVSNIPGATEMRVGNTVQELELSMWLPYSSEKWWQIRNGPGENEVFVEYRTPEGISRRNIAVPEFRPEFGTNYLLPIEAGNRMDPYDPDNAFVWLDRFDKTNGRWGSYAYHGGQHGNGNVFYPATHHPDGYIWIDDSRWVIDTPERPMSVLALLVYPNWLMPLQSGNRTVDLTNSVLTIDLMGKNLDLHGGTAHFWVTAPGGRWVVHTPVTIADGTWTTAKIDLSAAQWDRSWGTSDSTSDPINLALVTSFGIKFIDFPHGQMPTGVLAIDNISITKKTASGQESLDSAKIAAPAQSAPMAN